MKFYVLLVLDADIQNSYDTILYLVEHLTVNEQYLPFFFPVLVQVCLNIL